MNEDSAVIGNIGKAFGQHSQRNSQRAGDACRLDLIRLAHIEKNDIARLNLRQKASELIDRHIRGVSYDSATVVASTELVVVDWRSDAGIGATEGTFWITLQSKLPDPRRHGVVVKKPSRQRFSRSEDPFDRFHCLK